MNNHSSVEPNDALGQKAETYRLQCARVGRGHYAIGEDLSRGHLALGIAVVVLTSLVATSIFSGFANSGSGSTRLITGSVAAASTIFAALQTFLAMDERANSHKTAAASYGVVRRELEMFELKLTTGDLDNESAIDALDVIVKRLGDLATASPHLPARYFVAANASQDYGNAIKG